VLAHPRGRRESGLARELEALETGWRLGMHDTDWEGLLGLAHHHGWRPSAGLEHYLLLHEGRLVVSASEAQELAGALEVALRELPPERRMSFRPERKRSFRPVMGVPGGSLGEGSPPPEPGADYQGYFSWGRRWIVEEVRRLCRQGAVEIRPL
jgi:hypothetical protein